MSGARSHGATLLAVWAVVGDQMSGLEDKLKEGIVISLSFVERRVLLARGEGGVNDGQEMSMLRCL